MQITDFYDIEVIDTRENEDGLERVFVRVVVAINDEYLCITYQNGGDGDLFVSPEAR